MTPEQFAWLAQFRKPSGLAARIVGLLFVNGPLWAAGVLALVPDSGPAAGLATGLSWIAVGVVVGLFGLVLFCRFMGLVFTAVHGRAWQRADTAPARAEALAEVRDFLPALAACCQPARAVYWAAALTSFVPPLLLCAEVRDFLPALAACCQPARAVYWAAALTSFVPPLLLCAGGRVAFGVVLFAGLAVTHLANLVGRAANQVAAAALLTPELRAAVDEAGGA